MKKDTKKITIRLSYKDWKELHDMAKKNKMLFSYFVEALIIDKLNELKKEG